MCGISGYLNLSSGVQTGILRRMNDVIRHRGPDDEGYALIGPQKCANCGGPDSDPRLELPLLEQTDASGAFLGLGHRRLSILDLSPAGHQPMGLAERGLTVTYNGEIYNYPELKAELTALGHVFHTASDTEVLLAAYSQWGEDCLSHFNGMWGFALWDSRERKLFCARDRLGAKPFHYYHQGDFLLFGSELKQLCQDETIQKHFDNATLAANLMYHLSDYNDRTLIENMRVLRPGHKLVVRLSSDCRHIEEFTVSPYWQLETGYREDFSAAQWQEMVEEEFSRACRWRLRSDAPVGALLSGGLDSSCMVTELCSQLGDPAALQTFTTSYPGHSDCDEWHFADMVNRACGCTGHQFIPDPTDDIERRFENVVWHVEGFSGPALLGPSMLLEDIRRRGIKVILNGQCGDETMFGYERYYAYYFADLLKKGRVGTALREFRLASQNSRFSAGTLLQMMVYFNLPAVRDTRQLRRSGAFVRQELLQERDCEELHNLLYPANLQQLQKTELTATQLPHIVRYDDRLYMAASIESRIPFMDYRFVQLSAQIPPHMKIEDGYTKSIMRKIFDSRMPKEVTWRTNKMGFGAPEAQWMAAFSRAYLLDQLSTAKTAPYFHTDRLAKLVEEQPANPAIFAFLQAEQFARQFSVD
ncbi:MAG: asparagine synthase (glutamine-hydrolyzing) [Ruminococcaceae bacterium]|nr:asparagine synthase (glutamine-hydrolyzing) [Oscillospiraceae bacterium]